MKKLEKTALVLIVLYIVSTLFDRVGRIVFSYIRPSDWSATQTALLSVPIILISILVNIAIAIWLYRTSKKEGAALPWVWAIFGFMFSVPGAILFYAVRIYELLKEKQANQNMEPIVTTPVDEVEAQSTQAHV